ncbi:MAG: DUF6069 family protein [Candidatus Nanopelagicales bacterium]
MTLPGPLPRDPRPHRRVRNSVRAGLVWSVVASGINLAIWLFSSAIGIDFLVWPQGASEPPAGVGPLAIVGASLVAGLFGGIVTGVFARVVKHAVRWVIIGGAILTATSLFGPWEQPAEVFTSTRVALTLMHLVTGGLVTFGLARGIWSDDRAVLT